MKLNIASMRLRLGALETYTAELEKHRYLQEDLSHLQQFREFATRLVLAEEHGNS